VFLDKAISFCKKQLEPDDHHPQANELGGSNNEETTNDDQLVFSINVATYINNINFQNKNLH